MRWWFSRKKEAAPLVSPKTETPLAADRERLLDEQDRKRQSVLIELLRTLGGTPIEERFGAIGTLMTDPDRDKETR